MRKLALVVLVACSSHPPTAKPLPPAPPTPLPSPVAATPTDDAVPGDAIEIAELETEEYKLSVYQDGLVEWRGVVGVQSIGDRRGRVPVESVRALDRIFADAKFMTMEAPPSGDEPCETPSTSISYWPNGDSGNSITDDHCPGSKALTALETQLFAYAGADIWLHGNPGGKIPDGDHLLFSYVRTACFGSCPVFDVTVFDDGTVLWHGDSNVSTTGDQRLTIPPDKIQALIAAFDADGWLPPPAPPPPDGTMSGAVSYSGCTDTPHTIITYQRNGRHEIRENDHCKESWAIEDQLIELAGVKLLVHVPVEVLRYQQTACMGACPTYTVSVDDEGTETWKGEGHVETMGARTAQLDYTQQQAIASALDQAHFSDLVAHQEPTTCTDTARTLLTYSHDNQTETLLDPHCKANPALADLEAKLHGLLGIDAWIGTPAKPKPKHRH